MRRCQLATKFFTVVFLPALVTVAAAQTPSDLHVKLSLAENKTVYRFGEPIKLVLEFTADREGYVLETLPDFDGPWSDTVLVAPDGSFTRWADERDDNYRFPRDVISRSALTSAPQRVDFTLNDSIRFDSPGRYTMSVSTRRVSPRQTYEPVTLTTNAITIEIQPMSESDEAKEVKRLTDLLDARRDVRAGFPEAKLLSYLTGDPSTREKVKRFVATDERFSNYWGDLWSGLFVARNRTLVLNLIEAALRDPNIPATTRLLGAATRLKKLLTLGLREKPSGPKWMLEPAEDPRMAEVREPYLVELAAGLPKRTGANQTTTAITILTTLPKDSQPSNAALREVRQILLLQFNSLHAYDRDFLLQSYWDQLRDPALIPSLKKMMAASDQQSRHSRQIALQRLMELAPDDARPYVIAEIRDENSFVDPKLLGTLSDAALPEIDAPLLDQIRRLSASTQGRYFPFLKFKTALLARYATAAIYQDVLELYRTAGPNLQRDARAGLLAYLVKQNEREGVALIEQVISETEPGELTMTLSELTQLHYSEPIGALVKKLLDGDDVDLASHAAYLIGLHGVAGDEAVLEARLQRWREQWRDRIVEADAQRQGRIELEVILALTRGKAWKLPDERVKELQASCLTQICKQNFAR